MCGGGDAGSAFHLLFVSLPAGKNLYTNEYVAIKLVSGCQSREFLRGQGGGCSSHWEGASPLFPMELGWDMVAGWLCWELMGTHITAGGVIWGWPGKS